MSNSSPRRKRAVCLTPEAISLLKDGIQRHWKSVGAGRLTLEARAELLGLSQKTIERMLAGKGVDRASLNLAFTRVGIEWEDGFCQEPALDDSPIAAAPPSGATAAHAEPTKVRRPRPQVWLASITLLGIVAWQLPAVLPKAVASAGPARVASPREIALAEQNRCFADATEQYHLGKLERAREITARCMAEAKTNDSASGFAAAARLAGDISYGLGNYPQAEARFVESLEAWTKLGREGNIAQLHEALGNAQLAQRKKREAGENFEAALKGYREKRVLAGMAMAHRGLATLAMLEGKFDLSNHHLDQAEWMLRGLGELPMRMDLRGRRALLTAKLGDRRSAIRELRACLDFWREAKAERWTALVEFELGRLLLADGQWQAALSHVQSSEFALRRIGDQANLKPAQALRQLIVRHVERGDPQLLKREPLVLTDRAAW